MSMNRKTKRLSSISTPSAKKPTPKIPETSSKPETDMTILGQAEMVSRPSSSPLCEIYKTESFEREWVNDVRHHVSENLVYLRRYRGISQTKLGKMTGTSQSAIARIESGQENITLDTLERLVTGLDGRFYVSIHPPECVPVQGRPWWEMMAVSAHGQWSIVRMAARRTTTAEQMIVGLERQHIASANTNTITGVTGLLPQGNTNTWLVD